MVEAGFTRAKNACNILMKNFMDFGMGAIAFFFIGFGVMFGVSGTGWFGASGFMLSDFAVEGDPWVYAFFMFQVVFAATAATIVSGAVAERTKFSAYLVFSAVMCALVYPVFGSWAWGSLYKGAGWLENLGFIDFAGSTVVHSVGGWAALAGAIVVGPRLGKYRNGKPTALPGHSIPLAALGVLILFFGWFGFTAGSSVTSGLTTAQALTATQAAAASGALTWLLIEGWHQGKATGLGFASGILAGLVAVTPAAGVVQPGGALVLGLLASVVCYLAISRKNKLVYDDTLDAFGLHGVGGMVGALALTFFIRDSWMTEATAAAGGSWTLWQQLGVQAAAVGVAVVYAALMTAGSVALLGRVVPLRAPADVEKSGLDPSYHGERGYGLLNVR